MQSDQSLKRSMAALGGRVKQVREAKEMEKVVLERATRLGVAVPPYEFLELIGKGSFGRVFKSRRLAGQGLVAVKIVDVDRTDYKLEAKEKDQALKDLVNEISILQTLKDSKAKNINIIHEAFTFHSQLWIVSEYCPGGSVHTLMKAKSKPGLEERYIVVIARELAIALKHVHEAGIIHRDVKAANILITQDGQLQLCDFGVSGVLESNAAKRSTIIGTPYWMPPEMHNPEAMPSGYGTEIDCWAFGCTMYELATGLPPNAKVAQNRLHMFLRKPPRLEEGEHSTAVRDFVSFCLTERPSERPTADGILNHSFVANTSKKYPTTILRQLIDDYAQWEQSGGQRMSLFNAFGASAPTLLNSAGDGNDEDEWNFSTTDDFALDYLHQPTPLADTNESFHSEIVPKTPRDLSRASTLVNDPVSSKTMSPFERAKEEERIRRAERKMKGLFDTSEKPYEYDNEADDDDQPSSDLPFRNLSTTNGANRETLIDLDAAIDFTKSPDLDLTDASTIRASKSSHRFLTDDDDEEEKPYLSNARNLTKRLTRDWKFPVPLTMPNSHIARPRTQDWSFTAASAEVEEATRPHNDVLVSAPTGATNLAPGFRPILTRTATVPVGAFGDHLHPESAVPVQLSSSPDRSSLLCLDSAEVSRPSTSAGYTNGSSSTDRPPHRSSQPEDPDLTLHRRGAPASFHFHSQSESTTELSSGESQYDSYSHSRWGSQVDLGHIRDGSFSSESDFERIRRTLSVKESMESLRHSQEAEEYWETDVQATLRQQVRDMTVRRPLLATPKSSFTAGNWAAFDPDSNPAPSRSGLDLSRLADTSANGFGMVRRLSGARRSPLVNGAKPSSKASSVGSVERQNSQRNRRHVIQFPHLVGPDAAALEEGADPEVVVQEVQRLLEDYLAALRAAGAVLKSHAGGGGGGGVNGELDGEDGVVAQVKGYPNGYG